jgi:hypothetical protein
MTNFTNNLNYLLLKDSNPAISYSIKYTFAGIVATQNVTKLQGYGVFLDIKNMEYKNVDDSNLKNEHDGNTANDAPISFPEGEEIEGIVFSKLVLRDKMLASELKMPREELLSKAVKTEVTADMKVWKMKDLGLQTVFAVKSHQVNSQIYDSFPLCNL